MRTGWREEVAESLLSGMATLPKGRVCYVRSPHGLHETASEGLAAYRRSRAIRAVTLLSAAASALFPHV